jgi:NAD dependent epimerase/dehydratase family enzyme
MSCIEVDDLASMVMVCLHDDSISGPMNAVMPEPVTNAEFTKAVSRAVHRPAFLPAPAFALRLMLGDLSHLLLDSQRVVPVRFTGHGFRYRFDSVGAAMEEIFR